MPIAPSDPFKGRHFPGEVIRLSAAYDHVAELLAGIVHLRVHPIRTVEAHSARSLRCPNHLAANQQLYLVIVTWTRSPTCRFLLLLRRARQLLLECFQLRAHIGRILLLWRKPQVIAHLLGGARIIVSVRENYTQ